MKYAVARMQGAQPRMFTGRYDDRSVLSPMTPITTGLPDCARLYDDLDVVTFMAAVLNVLDRVNMPGRPVAWVAMPMPEQVSA